MKKIDLYIIRKFLGTFFFSLALLIVIVIIFDVSEKIDDFIDHHVPLSEIIFRYYFTFIPYFVNLFSPLFTFIAVIYFTSRMAYNTEIIAILSGGISFRRLLLPYLISAIALAGLSYYLSNFLIPETNKIKIDFESHYIKKKAYKHRYDIHVQNKKGQILYVESFNNFDFIGYNFSIDNFQGQQLRSKLTADRIVYDTLTGHWKIHNYFIRYFHDSTETFRSGRELDTTFNVKPADFSDELQPVETMGYNELRDFIKMKKLMGSEKVKFYEVEKYRRVSGPFATLILTFIGVALSSRKLRGGIGLQLALGILISFSFIIVIQISTVFSTFSTLSPWVAVWIPNFIFGLLAIYLIRRAPK